MQRVWGRVMGYKNGVSSGLTPLCFPTVYCKGSGPTAALMEIKALWLCIGSVLTSLSYTSPFDRGTCKILCISCSSVLRPMPQLRCHMRNQDLHAPSPTAKCPDPKARIVV